MKNIYLAISSLILTLCGTSEVLAGGGGSGYRPIYVSNSARCVGQHLQIEIVEQTSMVKFAVQGSFGDATLSEAAAIYFNEDSFEITVESLSSNGEIDQRPQWKIEEYGSWAYQHRYPPGFRGLYRASVLNGVTNKYEIIDDRVKCYGLNDKN